MTAQAWPYYDRDTVVVDDFPDDMFFRGDDQRWHRELRSHDLGFRYACGQQPEIRLISERRRGDYPWPLCPDCFSVYEIDLSNVLEMQRRDASALGSRPPI